MGKHTLIELFSSERIECRTRELAERINKDYAGRPLVMICVLKGAFLFFADLVKHITVELEVDFLRAASYGDSDTPSGAVQLTKDIELSLQGKDVLLVDDIVDTGHTMAFLKRELESRGVNSLRIAALVDKLVRREAAVAVDYSGFTGAYGYIVGYGLDFAERYRELPAIYELKAE